ncbi:MAG: PD-(D/E)XK nuclease family protein [Chloroflexota bacterium]|nr:PD-(D/E)XK nuclease family protein [Chloroflexota bacterium]
MISLKRNSKGQFVNATGLRSRKSSIYSPNQHDNYRISRTKFSDFLACPRCFYSDRVLGIVFPDLPGWSLNETTDILLKREFDRARSLGEPHRIFRESGLEHIVPFDDPDIDKWRNSLSAGISTQIFDSNIVLFGGIDDICIDLKTNKLVVVDYKSQASKYEVETSMYLAGTYHQTYKMQMDIYTYILSKMGFEVSGTSYFYVCNADRQSEKFQGVMQFSETLVPYEVNLSWIEPKLEEMLEVLNSRVIPDSNPSCMNCAYVAQSNNLMS